MFEIFVCLVGFVIGLGVRGKYDEQSSTCYHKNWTGWEQTTLRWNEYGEEKASLAQKRSCNDCGFIQVTKIKDQGLDK